MPVIHSRTRIPAPRNSTDTARVRAMLQADLRAMTIPPHATVPIDPDLTSGAQRRAGRLGDYLHAHGLISESALAAALAEQQRRIAQDQPIALGDLLVEQGVLTTQALLTVLMLQQLDHQSGVISDPPLRLGDLLVQAGMLRAEQLQAALIVQAAARQRGEDLRLGQVLIEMGVLTPAELEATLGHQHHRRTSATSAQLNSETSSS